jgi:hypothetical protein
MAAGVSVEPGVSSGGGGGQCSIARTMWRLCNAARHISLSSGVRQTDYILTLILTCFQMQNWIIYSRTWNICMNICYSVTNH